MSDETKPPQGEGGDLPQAGGPTWEEGVKLRELVLQAAAEDFLFHTRALAASVPIVRDGVCTVILIGDPRMIVISMLRGPDVRSLVMHPTDIPAGVEVEMRLEAVAAPEDEQCNCPQCVAERAKKPN